MKIIKALFIHSHVFSKYKGEYYSEGKLTYKMWTERYLKYIDEIVIAGRAKEVSSINGLDISSGKNVKHIELENIDNLKGIFNRKSVYKKIEANILNEKVSVIIARLPCTYGLIAIKIARKLNIPYIIEMVGDPFESYWNHGKITGKLYAPISYFQYRNVFAKAKYCIFVTEKYLQNKYVKKKILLSENISNVNIEISKKYIEKEYIYKKNSIEIGLIGSYSSKYKGIDTAIKSLKRLNDIGISANLNILGSGDKSFFNDLIKELKIEDKIVFVPSKTAGDEVYKWLKTLDIYIQPSLTEGLPRALIEAMSIGLPSVGTSVGGIPELLDNTMLISKNDDKQLFEKINELINNKNLYKEQSIRNHKKSLEYTKENLAKKRNIFWKKFKLLEGLE